MEIFISVTTAFLCFFLILYFRRKDKRNTQLSTLKNFISTSVTNMKMMFRDREKDLLDKTINLDISLKKLDKATTYINNKLVDIKDTLARFQEIREGLSGDLKQASKFDSEISSVKEKLSDINEISGRFETLKREMSEMKKTSAQTRSEIEQSKEWARKNIEEFMNNAREEISGYKDNSIQDIRNIEEGLEKKSEEVQSLVSEIDQSVDTARKSMDEFRSSALVELDDREREIEETIGTQFTELSKHYEGMASDLQAVLNEKIESFKKETETASRSLEEQIRESKEELLNGAKELKTNVSGTLGEINSRWNEAVKRFNEMNREVLSKSSDLEKRLDQSDKIVNKKLEDTEALLLKSVAGFESSLEDIISRKSEQYDKEFSKIESGVKARTNSITKALEINLSQTEKELREAMEDKVSSIDNDLRQVAKELEGRKTEIGGRMEALASGLDKQFKEIESGYNSRIAGMEQRFGKINSEIAVLEKKLQVEAENLFTRANTEIMKEIDSLKKSLETSVEERLSGIDGRYEQTREEIEKNLVGLTSKYQEEASDIRETFESRIATFRADTDKTARDIAGEMNEAKKEFLTNLQNLKNSTGSTLSEYNGKLAEAVKRFNEMNREILSKSSELETRLSQTEKIMNKKLEDTEALLSKSVTGFESSLEDIISRKSEQYDKEFSKIESGVKARTNSITKALEINLSQTEKELREAMEDKVSSIDNDLRQVAKELEGRKTEIGGRMEALASGLDKQFKEIESGYNSRIAGMEQRFGKINSEIAVLEKKLQVEAENLFTRANTEIMKEIDSLKKSLETSVEERLSGIDGRYEQTREEIEKNLVGLTSKYQEEASDIRETFESRIAAFRADTDKAAHDIAGEVNEAKKEFLTNAQNLKNSTGSTLSEYNGKLAEAVKRFNEMSREILSKSSELEARLAQSEKTVNKKLEDTQALLSKSVTGFESSLEDIISRKSEQYDKEFSKMESGVKARTDSIAKALEINLSQTEKELREAMEDKVSSIDNDLRQVAKELEGRKSEIGGRMEALASGLDKQFKEIESGYNSRIAGMEQKFGKINSEIAVLEKKIQSEAETLFSKANAEIMKEIDSLKKSLETSVEERLSGLDGRYEQTREEIEKNLVGLISKYQEEASDIRETFEEKIASYRADTDKAAHDVAGEVNEAKKEFLTNAQNLKNSTGSTLSEYNGKLAEAVKRFNEMSREILSKSSELETRLAQSEKTVNKKLEDTEALLKAKSDSLSKNIESGFIQTEKELRESMEDRVSSIEIELRQTVKEFEGRKSEIGGRMEALASGLDKQFKEIESGYNSRIAGMEQKFGKINSEIAVLEKKIQSEAETLFSKANAEIMKEIDSLKKSLETSVEERLSGLDGRYEQTREEIEKNLVGLISKYQEEASDIRETFEEKIASYRADTDKAAHDVAGEVNEAKKEFLTNAQNLKNSTGSTLSEYNGKLAEAVKRFNEMSREILSKSSELETRLAQSEKTVNKKLEDTQALLSKSVTGFESSLEDIISRKSEQYDKEFSKMESGVKARTDSIAKTLEINLSQTEKELRESMEDRVSSIEIELRQTVKEFEERKTEIGGRMEALASGLDKQFKEIESGYNSRITGMEQKFGKINSEISVLEKRIQSEAENLFTRANAEIMKEIDSLKKSLETSVEERLSGLDGRYEVTREEIEKNLVGLTSKYQEEASDIRETFESRIAAYREESDKAAKEVAGEVNEAKKEFLTAVQNLKNSTGSTLSEYSGKLAEAVKRFNEMSREIFSKSSELETRLEQSEKIVNKKLEDTEALLKAKSDSLSKNIESTLTQKISSIESGVKEIETRYNSKVAGMEEKFGSMNNEIEALQAKISGEADAMFKRAGTEITREIENMKKSAIEKTEERLNALDEQYSRSEKKFEEEFNLNMKNINVKLAANSGAVNEMGGKLSKFVKEITDKFKDDVAELQKQASIETNALIGEIAEKEKELGSLLQSVKTELSGVGNEIKGQGKEAAESALQKIRDKEKEIFSGIDKSTVSISEKLSLLERTVTHFETEFGKKLKSSQTSLMGELEEYKNNVESLKTAGLKAQTGIQDIIAGKSKEMDKFVDDLKIGFVGDYKELISNTRNEIKELKNEIAAAHKAAADRKDHVIKEISSSLEEARSWSLTQIGTLKDEIESAKLRTGAMIEDLREESESKLNEYNSALAQKLAEALKGSDGDFIAKRTELRNLTNEMIVQVNEKDKEMNKKIERLSSIMDEAVRKADIQLNSINKNIEQRFQKFYEELSGKGESGLQNFRHDIDGILEEVKLDTMNNIEFYKKELAGLKGALSDNKSEIINLQKELDQSRNVIDSARIKSAEELNAMHLTYEEMRREISTLEKAIEERKAGFEGLIKDRIKEIYDKIDLEKTGMDEELSKLRQVHTNFLEGLREQDRKFIAKNSDENVKMLQSALNEYRVKMEEEIDSFKDSFTPPADEIVKKLNGRALEIQDDMEKKAGAFAREIGDFTARAKQREDELSKKTEAIITGYASKIEEYKNTFSDGIGVYLTKSSEEYKKVFDRIAGMEKELRNFEEKTIVSIRNKAITVEGEISKKIKEIAAEFDSYVKKGGEEIMQVYNSGKKDITALAGQLKNEKEDFKAEILEDIKELNKKTREIEARYDGLLKKSSVLERAEGLAAKSNSQIEIISQFLKELDSRRKDIEESLKTIDLIRIENRDLSALFVNIGNNKKETALIYQTVTEALQKARETEGILTLIEKQQGKAEEVRNVLLETLKSYEDIKLKAADVEKKKEVINKIMNSIETSKEDLKDVHSKIAGAEEKLGGIVKTSKKIEDDIKNAQANITKIFGDQDKVSYAVDKIVDIDNLLVLIEEESKKVQKMRDWVAKLENRLERVKDSQETSLGSRPGSRRALSEESGADEDVIKNILRLKEQAWSIEDISKSLKISRAYVELIFERHVQ